MKVPWTRRGLWKLCWGGIVLFLLSYVCLAATLILYRHPYRIDLTAGDQLLVSITGPRKAYVIAQCVTPAPACLGNMLATDGNPLAVTPAAGPSFVIVDDENPASTGTFTLTLTVQ